MTRNSYYYLLDENGHLTKDITRAIYVFIRDRAAYQEFWNEYRFIGLRGITDNGVWIFSEHADKFIEESIAYEVLQTSRWIEDNSDKDEFYAKLAEMELY